jgi:hypothetical protein
LVTPSVPAFVNERAATGYECQNRETSRGCLFTR